MAVRKVGVRLGLLMRRVNSLSERCGMRTRDSLLSTRRLINAGVVQSRIIALRESGAVRRAGVVIAGRLRRLTGWCKVPGVAGFCDLMLDRISIRFSGRRSHLRSFLRWLVRRRRVLRLVRSRMRRFRDRSRLRRSLALTGDPRNARKDLIRQTVQFGSAVRQPAPVRATGRRRRRIGRWNCGLRRTCRRRFCRHGMFRMILARTTIGLSHSPTGICSGSAPAMPLVATVQVHRPSNRRMRRVPARSYARCLR